MKTKIRNKSGGFLIHYASIFGANRVIRHISVLTEFADGTTRKAFFSDKGEANLLKAFHKYVTAKINSWVPERFWFWNDEGNLYGPEHLQERMRQSKCPLLNLQNAESIRKRIVDLRWAIAQCWYFRVPAKEDRYAALARHNAIPLRNILSWCEEAKILQKIGNNPKKYFSDLPNKRRIEIEKSHNEKIELFHHFLRNADTLAVDSDNNIIPIIKHLLLDKGIWIVLKWLFGRLLKSVTWAP